MLKFKQASWNPRVASSNTRDTSSNLWDTSSNPQVTSSNPRVTNANPRVTSSNSEFTSLNPRVQESLIYWKLKYTAFKFLLETEKKEVALSVSSHKGILDKHVCKNFLLKNWIPVFLRRFAYEI